MLKFSRLILASVFVSATALAACGGNGTAPSSTTAEAKGEAAPQVAHLPFLDHALNSDAVALRPEQRTTLEAVRADLALKTADSRKEAKAFAELLAKEVEAGKVDRAVLDAQIAKMQASIDANRPAFEAAMVKVHDTLDMSQRKALVESMHGTRSAHKHHEGKAEGGKHHGGHEGGFGFHKEMKELNLTSDQKDALHTAMKAAKAEHESEKGDHDFQGMKLKMKANADAFVSDTFDAKAIDLGKHSMGQAKWATRAARFVEAAIPILTAEQRTLLAKQIRARAEKIPG